MDVDEQANDELLDFDEDQEFYDGEGGAAGGDEQLDYGDEAVYDEAEDAAALEGYQEEPAHTGDEADAEYLESLQEEDAEEPATHMQANGNEQAAPEAADHQQGEQEQSAGSKKIIDLTKASNRLERLQQRMQPQPQQAPSPEPQPQPPPQLAPKPQQPPPRAVQQQRAPRSGTGIKRYFMLKSVNAVNWDTARKYNCWATQPQNEQRFDEAFKSGHTVIFFLSINASGAIQGYGRMMSTTTDGPDHVPWQDIKEQVSNFSVSWDCSDPMPFDAVRNLTNPFVGNAPLNRHKDGWEIAPRCGEPLLAAMNRNAAQLGNASTGPLASWGLQRGIGPAAAGGVPQQQRMGQPGMMGRGGVGGRGMGMQGGMVGGRGGVPGRGMAGRGIARGRGGLPQPPPPPRPGAAGFRPGQHQQPPAGLARFVGRLEGLTGPGSHQMQQQRHMQQPQLQQQYQRGVSPSPRSYHSGSDGYRDGYREPFVRSRSRSRSRSPVSRHAARGDSRSRADVGGKQLDKTAESQSRLESQGSENITYEMYLAAYDKVQQRLKTISKITEKDNQQQRMPQGQQQQQRQIPGRPGGDAVSGQLVPYGGGGDSPRGVGSAAAAAGGTMQQRQQMMQQRVRPGGAVGVSGMPAGSVMNGDGSAMTGRAAMQAASDIPTLEEYIQRIRASYMQKRGQACPYTDQQIALKYQERMTQMKGTAPAAGGAMQAAGRVAAGRMNPRAALPAAAATAGRPVGGAAAAQQGLAAAGMGTSGMASMQGMPGGPVASGSIVSNPMQNPAAGGLNPAAAMLNPMMAMNPAINPQAAMMMGAMNPMAAMAMMGAAAGGLGMGMNPMGMNPAAGMGPMGAAGAGMNPMMMQSMGPQGRMGGRGGGNMGGQRGQQKRGRY